ncbi:hypothetical protein Pmar_PMAR017922, partial [Perkinsus marinus ATCC 50983]
EERKAGQGARAGAEAFEHQLPLELVTCEVCAMRGRHDDEGRDVRPRAAELREVNRDLRICKLEISGSNPGDVIFTDILWRVGVA